MNREKDVLLITVSKDMDAVSIIHMLQEQGIPVLKKYRGTGDYSNILMGYTPMGIDLFVPSELYEKAKAILEGLSFDHPSKDIEEDTDSSHQAVNKGMRVYIRLLALLFALAVVWGIVSIFFD